MRLCGEAGCGREHHARGCCKMHWKRKKKQGLIPDFSYTKTCTIDGCDIKHYGKGYCMKHFGRFRDHGENKSSWYDFSETERFYQKTKLNQNTGCLEWTGGLNTWGYGQASINKTTKLAHRHSYEISVGEIPKGMLCCHHCDNPKCIEPSHLFIGTNADNAKDKVLKNRQKSMKGESCVTHKLKDCNIRALRELNKSGMKISVITDLFRISRTQAYRIINNQSWAHVV